jgi:hypothetical protein
VKIPYALLIVFFFVLTVFPFAIDLRPTWLYWYGDERNLFLPLVVRFAQQWPFFDIAHYSVPGRVLAMGPGYFMFMATIYRFVSSNLIVLRLINSLVGLCLFLYLYRYLSRACGKPIGFLLTLSFVFSRHAIGSEIYLHTEMLALLFSAIALVELIAPGGQWRFAISGVCVAGAVLVRQNLIWLCAPIAASPLVDRWWQKRSQTAGSETAGSETAGSETAGSENAGSETAGSEAVGSGSTFTWALVGCAIPLATLGALCLAWGGHLAPPGMPGSPAIQPSSIPFALSLIGIFTLVWLPVLRRLGTGGNFSKSRAIVLATLAVISALVAPTVLNEPSGRHGGPLWDMTLTFPSIGGRSLLFVLLAPFGAFGLYALFEAARANGRTRDAVVLLSAFLGFLAVQVVSYSLYQRYFEPWAMLLFVLLLSLTNLKGKPAVITALAFSLFNLAITVIRVYMVYFTELRVP